VNKTGRLAPNFAFDGAGEQRKRLLAEGVAFEDENHVEMEKNLFVPSLLVRKKEPKKRPA
jgi:alkylated DNA nucleotide flippase Atl1